MIRFQFKGNASDMEQEKSKEWFLKELGPFREEFESNNGVVMFDYDIPETSANHCEFSYDLPLNDFMSRWETYRKSREQK